MSVPLLAWEPARKEHRTAIAHFVCAIPEKPTKDPGSNYTPYHPAFWEYDAQQMIRSLAKKIPPPTECRTWVGLDSDGVAAVSSYTQDDGPGVVHLDVMGVAVRCRHRGGAFAREMMRFALQQIEAEAVECHQLEMVVSAEVHKDNVPSLHLVHDFGFQFDEQAETGAQTWVLRFPLAQVEE